MSSVVTGVLNLTVGLAWSKFRGHMANKLSEGDLTDEKCRQMIVDDLDDIKTKLDGLSRKDLLSSVSFLTEGLGLLKLSQASTDGGTSFAQEHQQDTMMAVASSLSQGISELKITSKERFTAAKSSFKQSNTEATRAFNNAALSTDDRIMSIKLRVMSRIFEFLEDPDAAANSCMLYLQELHNLPAVREIFSVQISGGMKSVFSKTKRLENVMSVTMINFVVFDFIKKLTKIPVNLFNWPTITIGKRTYNPMITDGEVLEEVKESGARPPNQLTLMKEKESVDEISFSRVNSEGEIVAVITHVYKFTAGEGHLSYAFPQAETKKKGFEIRSLAIDEEDNVYIVTSSQPTGNAVIHFKLFVFDAKGNMKHDSALEFLNGNRPCCTIAVTKDMVVICKEDDDRVYVCDGSGQLKYSFPLESVFSEAYLSISDKNEIIAAESSDVVYIYTEEGKLKKKFEVTEDHEVCGVAFNHVTKEIIVLTEKNEKFYLSSYSETGEFRRPSQRLPSQYEWLIEITSHPSGPVALISYEHVLYIQ